ncbi:ABC transporter ATP-binding protein [Actimicrobium sp. CCC2.4]|uniref:ABC transporter ATP-binding protein n=1 Tax=Actimicrobium sp. CCC2.4 TaxID=3048606 RepID=UPI002AC8F7E4|nr:ABC transporter ATP-binding protein [Actimicrobium sp. CCC2.4]MEB0134305.1 ABC transporter ATP-binding protein [Actimicrobium sp. CCC2.4]WPX32948.1 ABC transporter ATP-binding protein [Actimicrobium sp. CCC2.4]
MATNVLELDKLNAFYADSHVLHDVSLALAPGKVLALLGRNGAGKSTCISAIAGFVPPRSGRVLLDGVDLARCTPEQISRAGIGLVPQGRRIFGSLTVRENLLVASRKNTPPGRRCWSSNDVNAMFPRLRERQHQLAASLSGGEQQMLAIGRALMTNPSVLLMDEPSEGLAPQIVREVGEVLEQLKSQIAILLVEQNLGLAMKVADEVVLLNTGRVVFAGSSAEFRQQQAQLQSHLGIT